MTAYTLTIPSKTFLLGEYAVLDGAPALILATSPHFRYTTSLSPLPFHPESPAGKQLATCPKTGDWFDPHAPHSGLGGSSAQWLASLAEAHHRPLNPSDVKTLWERFPKGQGSGADMVCQCLGQVTLFQTKPWHAAALPWTLPSLGFALIHTQQSLATHHHLSEDLGAHDALYHLAKEGVDAYQQQDESAFLACINAYQDTLHQLKRSAPHTQTLLNQLDHPEILAKKGCGAMGSDVILILYKKQASAILKPYLSRYHVIADDTALSPGLSKQMTP